jgi:hypothetical protein
VSDGIVGDKALQCSDTPVGDNWFYHSEWIPCTPDGIYHASVWARQPSGNKHNYLTVRFNDASGNNIPGGNAPGWTSYGTYYYWQITNGVFPTGWTYYDVEFGGTAVYGIPSNAVTMKIGCLVARATSVGSPTATVVQFQDYRLNEAGNINVATYSGRRIAFDSTVGRA